MAHTITFTVPIVATKAALLAEDVRDVVPIDYIMSFDDIDIIHRVLYNQRLRFKAEPKEYSTAVEYYLDVTGCAIIVKLSAITMLLDKMIILQEALGNTDNIKLDDSEKRTLVLTTRLAKFDVEPPFMTYSCSYEWTHVSDYDLKNLSNFLKYEVMKAICPSAKVELHNRAGMCTGIIIVAIMHQPEEFPNFEEVINEALVKDSFYSLIGTKKFTLMPQ